jgi:DnaK suppressor protein
VTKAPAEKTVSKKSVVSAKSAPTGASVAKKSAKTAAAAPASSAKAPSAAQKKATVQAPAPKRSTELTPKEPVKAAKPSEKMPVKPSSVPLAKLATTKAAKTTGASAPTAPPPPPPTSRFADRFAPPRPPTRQMSNLSNDLPRPVHATDPKLANAWKTKSGRDLTEDELLAMPESEYMKERQLDFFRSRLQAQKDNLLSNAGETTEHLREDTSIVPDPADRATIEEEHALELRTRDRERKLLKKISQSLMRIENGEYGFCDETGEPIGLGRLIARPTATLSLEAQQRRELKQKMFGD